MEGRRPAGHITAHRGKRLKETRRRQRRMGASSERGHGPRRGCGAIGGIIIIIIIIIFITCNWVDARWQGSF